MYEPAEDSFLLAEEVRRHLNALPENHKNLQNLRLRHKWRSLFGDFFHSEFLRRQKSKISERSQSLMTLKSQKATIHLRIKKRSLLVFPDKKKAVKILDMGSGSGIQAEACLQAGVSKRDILVADIDQEVVSYLKEKDFKAVHSNLFSKIKGKFDLIIFNPPYLPEHSKEKGLDTTGGKNGYETIIRFIRQAKTHLKKGGKIFLLFSSLSKPEIIKQEAKKYYAIKEKANKKLFFEKLFVFELKGKN